MTSAVFGVRHVKPLRQFAEHIKTLDVSSSQNEKSGVFYFIHQFSSLCQVERCSTNRIPLKPKVLETHVYL